MYARLFQLNQQMILAAGPFDVNPTAVLLLQPLFLLLSPVGGSAVAHPNQSSFPLLSICDSTAPSSPSPGRSSLGALGTVWSTWSTTESHRKMTVRERLTVGTHHAHGRMHATERGEVNVVKERLPLEVYCTWRVSVGSMAAASASLLRGK